MADRHQPQDPVVGSTHEVPCIYIGRGGFHGGGYVPVHLPIHRDPELGAPQAHVHLDLRFLSLPSLAGAVADPFAAVWLALVGLPREAVLLPALFFQVIDAEPQDIVIRPMVCQRPMPPYPRHLAQWLREGTTFVESYRTDCPSSNRCPHKGLPLIQGADGRRHCPGHGLCFDTPKHKSEP